MSKSPTARSTIKNDPFAAVIPLPSELDLPDPPAPKPPATAPDRPATERRPERVLSPERHAPPRPPPAERRAKPKLTVHLSPELADRVKNAAYWNPKLTIAGIAEKGIRHEIDKLEREHGGKYPPRDGELIGGRPIK